METNTMKQINNISHLKMTLTTINVWSPFVKGKKKTSKDLMDVTVWTVDQAVDYMDLMDQLDLMDQMDLMDQTVDYMDL
ncbi:hypothetical protein F2P81_002844 [Scophthalmus maximus]|uniref:Uncharacterized protein n=1 Tax=Scophthalmus maximus TaxID=52904 RepID=A0A6A4TM03_SCOMX|nr:hypothetical protein F2P81_002844 [Scophthalmus maximus]